METVHQETGELLSVEEPLKTQIISYQHAFTAAYMFYAIDAMNITICLWRVRVGGFQQG